MPLINQVTWLSLVLSGAALIRQRERGTLEHLLVMPVTPLEIMLAKLWSMGLVVLLAATASLFLTGTALQLFATTSIGIFMGTLACLVPRFWLMLLPLQMLSGSITLRKSMPAWFQLALLLIGCAFLAIALLRFRRTIGAMAS